MQITVLYVSNGRFNFFEQSLFLASRKSFKEWKKAEITAFYISNGEESLWDLPLFFDNTVILIVWFQNVISMLKKAD